MDDWRTLHKDLERYSASLRAEQRGDSWARKATDVVEPAASNGQAHQRLGGEVQADKLRVRVSQSFDWTKAHAPPP